MGTDLVSRVEESISHGNGIIDIVNELDEGGSGLIQDVLCKFSDEELLESPQKNQFYNALLIYLKHGDAFQKEGKLEKWKYRFRGKTICSFRGRSAFRIESIEIEKEIIIVDGICRLKTTFADIPIAVEDESGRQYDVMRSAYIKESLYESREKMFAEAEVFHVEIPIHEGMMVSFVAGEKDSRWILKPHYGVDIDLDENHEYSFCRVGRYFLIHKGDRIQLFGYTKRKKLLLQTRYYRSLKNKGQRQIIKEHREMLKIQDVAYGASILNRVAFVSIRGDGHLGLNLKKLYDECNEPKIWLTKSPPYSIEQLKEVVEAMYRSKIVVTDDYLYPLRKYGKKEGQFLIQVWHAAGAFKMFGMDSDVFFPFIEKKYHKHYDLVTVSSEYVRQFYSKAFQVPMECIRALGVPRTDYLFDEGYKRKRVDNVIEKYPMLEHKRIILYAPTFRTEKDSNSKVFKTGINFLKLSEVLPDDVVFAVCPHPSVKVNLSLDPSSKIVIIQDVSTYDIMLMAELLITDYSSVFFEFLLLNKPIAFYCYDLEDYNRDFYLDYDTDLPGIVLKTEEELFTYISSDIYEVDAEMESFKAKYLGGCDGNCTKRIIQIVSRVLDENRCV